MSTSPAAHLRFSHENYISAEYLIYRIKDMFKENMLQTKQTGSSVWAA